MHVQYLQVGDAQVETDHKGFLTRFQQWTPEVAIALAAQEDVVLTPEHWQVIDVIRAYYLSYGVAPPMRALAKALAEKRAESRVSSVYIYGLFPRGPHQQAGKYAGLPRPSGCM